MVSCGEPQGSCYLEQVSPAFSIWRRVVVSCGEPQLPGPGLPPPSRTWRRVVVSCGEPQSTCYLEQVTPRLFEHGEEWWYPAGSQHGQGDAVLLHQAAQLLHALSPVPRHGGGRLCFILISYLPYCTSGLKRTSGRPKNNFYETAYSTFVHQLKIC